MVEGLHVNGDDPFYIDESNFCAGRCFKIQRKKPWSALCMVWLIYFLSYLLWKMKEGMEQTLKERVN